MSYRLQDPLVPAGSDPRPRSEPGVFLRMMKQTQGNEMDADGAMRSFDVPVCVLTSFLQLSLRGVQEQEENDRYRPHKGHANKDT